jgi:hypothetical protein
MITPSFGITATERVLPRLALDFTTAALDPRVTFTRTGNTATVTNSSGVIVGINADLPRFDFDPVTLVCRGLLIEESRTNALLNSLIDGTSLATQSMTVTAAARTLSFYGTGQVVLSGAASATVTGTGAYPTRTTLTFTPSAGTLTLTVTGTVQFAQLEAGAFATSYIPTEASALTRNADVATMTGTNFSDWFNASEGSFVAAATVLAVTGAAAFPQMMSVSDGTNNNIMYVGIRLQDGRGWVSVRNSNSTTVNFDPLTGSAVANPKIGFGYKLNNCVGSYFGNTVSTDTATAIPVVDRMTIGSVFSGHLKSINYYPQRLTNAEVQSFSK